MRSTRSRSTTSSAGSRSGPGRRGCRRVFGLRHPELFVTRVTLDDLWDTNQTTLPCYTYGQKWNGWEMPYFTKRLALWIMQRERRLWAEYVGADVAPMVAWYNAVDDTFYRFDPSAHTDDREAMRALIVATFHGEADELETCRGLTLPGLDVTVYPYGDGWTWWTPENLQPVEK
jgi:hypothetical protein